jgi:hypothetical protein
VYEQTAGEFQAEEDGWVWANARMQSAWVQFLVNGRPVGSRLGEGYHWCGYAHASFCCPVRRGDCYRLDGGDSHSLHFYPFVGP